MDAPSSPAPSAAKRLRNVRGRMYEPAIGPRLKILLFLVFAATAVLGVTGIYLLSIDLLERISQRTYTNQFTLQMFVIHILVGLAFIVPFLVFGCTHLLTARKRKNRLAVKLGIALFVSGILVVVSGLALIQLSGLPQLPTGTFARWLVYVLHAVLPVAAVVLYVLHRRAGPDIQWKYGYAWGGGVAAFVAAMIVLHMQDPRQWFAVGPREGEKYFEPSKIRTDRGHLIPAAALMKDEYCMQCHEDIYKQHVHSAHHFSSFNNPPYRFSVREARKIVDEHGIPRASRWCAGCHDVVPFLSGAFDDPNFDDENHPTAKAGITCVVCHAVTNVNSTEGNAALTIEEPLPYPFAYSDNALLRWFSNQVLKAKPDFHKKSMLKPFHKNADINSEFCAACHKVSLPVELNRYKEFLRGQNHYDPFLLSGVSGHGALSFYYPLKAKNSCNSCHMPLQPSNDFGSKDFDGSGVRKVHDHFFPGANTGLPHLLSRLPEYAGQADGLREAIRKNADFLRGTAGINPTARPDASLRIDLFALKEGGTIDGRFLGPLRPSLPKLKPGKSYLVEVVIRTIAMGHLFTQGTVDSNEVWVDFTAKSNGKVIGRSGALAGADDSGPVDEWSHFLNVLMLDRQGKRVNRRNAQDIFTPLYNHQIPPGAGQVVHYELKVPLDVKGPIELAVRVRYRKFDFEYMSLVHGGNDKVPKLPIVDLCADRVALPVDGIAENVPEQTSPIEPAWQRWNDYGIGCFLEGFPDEKKGELVQAEATFQAMLKEYPDNQEVAGHAYLNLARVYEAQGLLPRAVKALEQAREAGAPWWTVAYFNGRVNLDNTTDRRSVEAAIANFRSILDPDKQPRERGFDFTKDYRVINELGRALFERASFERGQSAQRDAFLLEAIEQYERALKLDSENEKAHFGVHQCFQMLGRPMSALKVPEEKPKTDEASLQELANTLLDDKIEKTLRRTAAGRLGRAVTALGAEDVSAQKPKRQRFELLSARIEPYFHRESDPDLKQAAAFVLDRLHLELFQIFKPDELAQNEAIGAYRGKHEAADHAAEAIVIYSLHRPGAPGL